MSDNTDLPHPDIIVALVNEQRNVSAERKELGMDLQERMNHHKANSNLRKFTIGWMVKLDAMSEQEREDAIRHVNHALQAMRKKWDQNSHVGDLADMASAEPLIPAGKTTEADSPPAGTQEPVDSVEAYRASLREKGDERPNHLIEAERQRLAESNGEEPDLPEPAKPKRKPKNALATTTGRGDYTIQ